MGIRSYQEYEPQIDESAYIDPVAMVIGRVSIGEQSSLWPMVVARGDVNYIEIGARTNIQDGSVLHVTHDGPYSPGGLPLLIGDEVTVGHNVILHACTIESQCLIGMGSIVLDGAVVESGALLGAGALVTPGTRIQGGYLWLGAPAKKIRALSSDERESILYSAQHYVRLAEQHQQDRPKSYDELMPDYMQRDYDL
jgi:carbonic anhydrase/acetyltransferase-like protein (isoleucine patch superfamily)